MNKAYARGNCMEPGLFGLNKSNRDFTSKDSWGKNQFNSSFPTALACYMASKNLPMKFLSLGKNMEVEHGYIDCEEMFGKKYDDPDLFFSFESDFSPFHRFVFNNLPRIDIVTMNSEGQCLRGLEIKLTALPDNSTCHLTEDKYGCEIVVRPDTIVYMALSIILSLGEDRKFLKKVLSPLKKITDWSLGVNVLPHLPTLGRLLETILSDNIEKQTPLILQPVWKTIGKSQILDSNAFDIFVWTDFSFTQLFFNVVKKELNSDIGKITRQNRSAIWLIAMLNEFAMRGKMNAEKIIDELSYNTKNDKAFAVSGKVSYPFMKSAELTTPRVKATELKNIILGGGQKLLSPERRLDAVILGTPGLFDNMES